MDSAHISSLLAPVVAVHGLELDRLELSAAGKRSTIRVFLDGDGPAGLGPSLDQIAEATKAISIALDAADPTKGRPYTLEVSSRGVGRPLSEGKHYRRNRGRLVRVTTNDGEQTGRIVAVDEEHVELEIDGRALTVPLAVISKALVQVELNRSLTETDEEDGEV